MRELRERPQPLWEQMARALESFGSNKFAMDLREMKPESFGNIIFGCTVENDLAARARLPHLARARREGLIDHAFVSYEPALGRVDFSPWLDAIDWLILGGASGSLARPSHPDWFSAAIALARKFGLAVFFKQWGEWHPTLPADIERRVRIAQDDAAGPRAMYRVGRAEAGKRHAGELIFEWPCLRGTQDHAFAWLLPEHGAVARGMGENPGHAVWASPAAARAAQHPGGAELFKVELGRPYMRAVYARAENETYTPEQDRLRFDAQAVCRV